MTTNYLIQTAIDDHNWYTEGRSSRPELAKAAARRIHREYKFTKWTRVVAVNGDRVIWSLTASR